MGAHKKRSNANEAFFENGQLYSARILLYVTLVHSESDSDFPLYRLPNKQMTYVGPKDMLLLLEHEKFPYVIYPDPNGKNNKLRQEMLYQLRFMKLLTGERVFVSLSEETMENFWKRLT